jgi:transglutaminase-like putative cysteine protease
MKKISLTALMLLFCSAIAIAQNKIPAFGKIDKADVEMKDCDFDPGAEAVVLIHDGEVRFVYVQGGGGWQSESIFRTRIKVLKSNAIDRAQIKIGYSSLNRRQVINNLNAISYTQDAGGNMIETKLEKNAVYDKKINREFSEISFAIPNVKVGTVFEYKYTQITKSYINIPAWYFQQNIPVKYSSYHVLSPDYYQFTVQTTLRQELEQKNDKYDGNWYIMRNIPGLKNEPYNFSTKDYIQRVEFQLSKIDGPGRLQEIRNTWPKLIDELLEDEDFSGAIRKNLKGTNDVEDAVAKATTTKEKINIVYKYVQQNMQWNNEYSRYSDNGVKDAWDKKNGNITDINFILIGLLRNVGIDAKPLLVSTKDNGTINTIYPFLNQFNAVMAYVKDGETNYIMNAADKFNAFNLIPYDVLYTNGLVVDKDNGGLIELNSDKKYVNDIFLNCNADANGKLNGEAQIKCSGYARNIRLDTYKKGELKKLLQDNEGINITVDSFKVNNEKNDTLPLEQKVNFSGSLQQSGGYYFIPISLFTGLEKNLFIDEERVMDIDFNYPKSYQVKGTYIIPDEFEITDLPKNTKIIMPDTSIVLTRMIQNDNNVISFKFKIDFIGAGYNAEAYPYVKEFFKKMYEIIDERIVMKKK